MPTLSEFGQVVWNAGTFGASFGSGQALAVKDLILYRALRLAQVTRGPGRTANPEQFQDALMALNGMLDSLGIQHDAIFSINNERYTLSPSKRSYSIGIDPLGARTADFQAPVPTRIDQARLVLTASASPVYLPLTIATADQWASITVRDVPTTVPQVMYCDYDYPIANLWFWGYPTAGNDVELWTWQTFTRFNTILDQVVMLPSYVDMCVYNLAVRLADQFGTVLSPNVMTEARRTLSRIKALNNPSLPMGSADYGVKGDHGGGRGDFNYMSGQ